MFTSFTLFIVGFPLISCILKDPICEESATPYMYKLDLAANLLEKIRLCGQFVDVTGVTDNQGRTYITYKAKIKDNSEASE